MGDGHSLFTSNTVIWKHWHTQEAPGGVRARGLGLWVHARPDHVPGGPGGCARAAPRVRPDGLPLAEQVEYATHWTTFWREIQILPRLSFQRTAANGALRVGRGSGASGDLRRISGEGGAAEIVPLCFAGKDDILLQGDHSGCV